jgi:hypothetical protein
MSGWLDTLFGNLPPQPKRPPSRGATFGAAYQDMPTSQNIDDRTVPGANVFPSRPHDQLRRMQVNPFGQTYNSDQWDYLQNHLPGGQPPTTPLQDPDTVLDPSIMAHIRAAQPQQPVPYWMQPNKLPGGPRTGPQISSQPPSQQPASQPSFQQLIDFLQSQGGAS